MEKMNLINSYKLQHCSLCCFALTRISESVLCVQERAHAHKDHIRTVQAVQQLSNMKRNVSPLLI